VSEVSAREVWTPDSSVFLYCFAVSLVMSVTFSLFPAIRSTRVSLAYGSGQSATPPLRLRFNLILLTAQIALSVSLLSGASLLTRSLVEAATGDAGFALEGVTVVTYVPGKAASQTAGGANAIRTSIEAAIAAADGLPQIAIVDRAPFTHAVNASIRKPEETARDARSVDIAPVSGNAFRVLGIPLIEGRPFSDRRGSGEAVVNRSLARLMWPGASAIGQPLVEGTNTYTVVGVTADVYFSERDSIRPTLHVPAGGAIANPALLTRGGGAIDERLRALIGAVDSGAIVTVRSLSEVISSKLTDSQTLADATWIGSLLALALATFGVFGVFAHVVETRRREIGIRLALGGQRRQVLAGLFRAARLAILGGLSLGLLLSLAIAGTMRQFLYGLSPWDPIAFGIVALILGVAGFVATAIPAHRALAVDPAVTLRQE
jgi:hypothetical protein